MEVVKLLARRGREYRGFGPLGCVEGVIPRVVRTGCNFQRGSGDLLLSALWGTREAHEEKRSTEHMRRNLERKKRNCPVGKSCAPSRCLAGLLSFSRSFCNALLATCALVLFTEAPARAYVNPGSGVTLWHIIISGSVGMALYHCRKIMNFVFRKRRKEKKDDEEHPLLS